ncbi:MAG: hypothetical protein K0B87_07115 [Candidatus Syntrophosphaera sp.]|nr:hypothetical protein [Candidatus Syntrophosphaera sp.]
MKNTLLVILLLIAGLLGAIDTKYPHLLAHLRDINPLNVDSFDDQVILRSQNYIWIHSTFNPWQPRLEAVFLSPARIEDVNMLGDNQLYVCTQEASNSVVTVDTLAYPGRIYFTNNILGDKITREGSMLYVADRFRGIDIIDIGKGGMREIKSTFSEKWGIRDFIAQYPYLYALNDFGLVTVDISDLQFPISLGVNYEISEAKHLAKNGDILWIGAGKRLLAINIADLKRPRLINQFQLPNDIQDMEVKDDRLFLALGRGGVKILGIKNPLRVDDLNTIYPAQSVYDIALDKDLIFLALGNDGWMVYEYR